MFLSDDPTVWLRVIADAVDPKALMMDYPLAVGGMLLQHSWNSGWYVVAVLIGAVFIWRKNPTMIWVTALICGLAAIGYLVFVDITRSVNIVPGTVMTIVSGISLILSFWVEFSNFGKGRAGYETPLPQYLAFLGDR